MKSALLDEDKLRSLGFTQTNKIEWVWGIRTQADKVGPEYVPIVTYNNESKIATVEVGTGSFTKKIITGIAMLKIVDTASFIIGLET